MTSFSIHGVGVSSGIAIGQAHLVSNALLEVVHYQLPKHLINSEIQRFSDAIISVKHDLEQIKLSLRSNAPAELSAFIGTHLMMLLTAHYLKFQKISFARNNVMQNGPLNCRWMTLLNSLNRLKMSISANVSKM